MHHGAGPRDQLVEVGPQLGLLDAALGAATPENKSFW